MVAGAPQAARSPGGSPCASLDGSGNEVLVLALDSRVRDLEDVTDPDGDVMGQMREDPRHPDESDLPLVTKGEKRLHGSYRHHLGRLGDMCT
jgi:hypothetical protein